ncbi:cell wall-binding repeat-containing protein [Phycicoccus flavus]|uniref:Cell wall-binding repeat-containing protein n=1 Tax=Phycicoccus flavus TaxID=2502783 RepID=A0A8T6R6N2_9MICO|nr:cell wall-binding repeat-containing protein [Phycicoccus flavus]NHA69223.1 cell wall-binding repeat-containing protein [Phycicoccus flavus]
MARLRPSLVLGVVAAVCVPAAAVAGPAAAQPSPGAGAARAAAPTSPGRHIGPQQGRLLGGKATTGPSLASADIPTRGIGAPTQLLVSDAGGTTTVTLDGAYNPQGARRTTTRTHAAAGPAGDAIAYTRTSDGATVTESTYGNHAVTYPSTDEPIAWGPLGDGFVRHTDGRYVLQFTNPAAVEPIDVPAGATDPVVSPYGMQVVVRVPTAGGHDLAGVNAPFSGAALAADYTVPSLGLAGYDPGAPAIAQAPGGSVYDDTALTYIAFVGASASTPAGTRHLFVDHQGGPVRTNGGYGVDVVDVIGAGYDCDVAAPAFSPDGTRLAYVRSPNADCTNPEVRVVTAGADGRFAAGSTSKLLFTTAGTTATAPTSLSWVANNPRAYRVRVDGPNRYATAANTMGFWDAGGAATAVITSGNNFPDALTGGPLAARLGGPVLLTGSASLHPAALEALNYGVPKGSDVYILGGTTAVSSQVWFDVRDAGYTPIRIEGPNRYAVAVKVAQKLDAIRGRLPDAAFVAGGSAFPDALVAGPPAALNDAPVLLSNGPVLPDVVKDYLGSLSSDADLYGIGGLGAEALSQDPRAVPVSGDNRYIVAANVAQTFFPWSYIGGIADGRNWPDAASGGALMAGFLEPVLLTNGRDTLPAPTEERLFQTRASADALIAFGGTTAVPADAYAAAASAAGRQTSYYGLDTQP